jgi:hypothetical protein
MLAASLEASPVAYNIHLNLYNTKWIMQITQMIILFSFINFIFHYTSRHLTCRINIHSSGVVSEFLVKWGIPVLSHPPHSSDLAPAEFLFPKLKTATRSTAWTVFARSNAGIVCSNPTQGMDVCVCLFCVCVVLYVGSGLATSWSPVKGVLLIVFRINKLKRRPSSNKGL